MISHPPYVPSGFVRDGVTYGTGTGNKSRSEGLGDKNATGLVERMRKDASHRGLTTFDAFVRFDKYRKGILTEHQFDAALTECGFRWLGQQAPHLDLIETVSTHRSARQDISALHKAFQVRSQTRHGVSNPDLTVLCYSSRRLVATG